MAQPPPEPTLSSSRLRRGLLIGAGTLFVLLAMLGIAIPVLPTTPFLLLAAACFARSSRRLYAWLFSNRLFGEYLRRYRAGEGIPLIAKISTLILLWGSLAASGFWAVPPRMLWLKGLLFLVGVGVTYHVVRIKTRRG